MQKLGAKVAAATLLAFSSVPTANAIAATILAPAAPEENPILPGIGDIVWTFRTSDPNTVPKQITCGVSRDEADDVDSNIGYIQQYNKLNNGMYAYQLAGPGAPSVHGVINGNRVIVIDGAEQSDAPANQARDILRAFNKERDMCSDAVKATVQEFGPHMANGFPPGLRIPLKSGDIENILFVPTVIPAKPAAAPSPAAPTEPTPPAAQAPKAPAAPRPAPGG